MVKETLVAKSQILGSERQSILPSMARKYPKVSVVVPCRNERNYIGRCVESIFNNGYPAELEVIVVDGISNDGTREILSEIGLKYGGRIRILDNPRRITPVALNLGIQVAQGEVILIIGAHCEIGRDYIRTVVEHLMTNERIACAGGRTIPVEGSDSVQRGIGAVLSSRFGVGNAYYRIPNSRFREVDTVAYGAYRREIFKKVGTFDERLVRNQDMEFNSRIRSNGYKVLLDPSVEIYYQPRSSLLAFSKQQFLNGFWNIITSKLIPGSMCWRHFVPFLFVSSLIFCALLGIVQPLFRGLFWSVAGSYLLADAIESVRIMIQRRRFSYIVTFLVFPVLHVSYGLGSVFGVFAILLGKSRNYGQKICHSRDDK